MKLKLSHFTNSKYKQKLKIKHLFKEFQQKKMPEHIPKEYIKDNSHISWIQDQERNNPNIHRYTEMMFYDYYDYLDMERRAIPIALILYSEEEKKLIVIILKKNVVR